MLAAVAPPTPGVNGLGVFFKLTGAFASAFASVCSSYVKAVNDDCSDDPCEVPLFSCLSPHQRIMLVSEVAVGVLCQHTPLPPSTKQHRSAFIAMWFYLLNRIEVECDTFNEDDTHRKGPEALLVRQERHNGPSEYPLSDLPRSYLIDGAKEAKQRVKDLCRAKRHDQSEQELEQKLQETPTTHMMNVEALENMINNCQSLFRGAPGTGFRPPSPDDPPLPPEEEPMYHFRRCFFSMICNQAGLSPNQLTFSWRCNDRHAFRSLSDFVTTSMFRIPQQEHRILIGPISNRSQEQRIRSTLLIKVARQLRSEFEQSWNYIDTLHHRTRIEALSIPISNLQDLVARLQELRESIVKDPSLLTDNAELDSVLFQNQWPCKFVQKLGDGCSFDERLEAFNAISLEMQKTHMPEHPERIQDPGTLESTRPHDHSVDAIENCCANCYKGDGKLFGSENSARPVIRLKKCQSCKVAKYCSKECQTNDWKERHKNECRMWRQQQQSQQ